MELASYSIELLSLLFLTAVIAGLLDTMAGGGGLITVPALILCGLPPLAALATNKLQASMGTATATYLMFKNKRIGWHRVKWLMLSAFIGSGIGTVFVQFIDVAVLTFVIPAALLLVGMYFLFSPSLGEDLSRAKVTEKTYRRAIVSSIGSYDGMFGPGTGSFYAVAGVAFRGHGLIESTAIAKSLNFATNIASLIVFIVAGHVVWMLGGLMMGGQMIGAWLGSHFLFKIRPQYLRLIVVAMCFGMLARYGYQMEWFY